MRRGWKRLAECGDNTAFAPEEISAALIPALEKDCGDIPPEFLNAVRTEFLTQEASLFKEQIGPRLEALRRAAVSGMTRVFLDQAIRVADIGRTNVEGLVEALTHTLKDRAARGARQVEEHYCRAAGSPRAQKVRARIEEAISGAALNGLARQVLNLDPRPASRKTARQKGLDDGVKL
jgi:hypothetical protein